MRYPTTHRQAQPSSDLFTSTRFCRSNPLALVRDGALQSSTLARAAVFLRSANNSAALTSFFAYFLNLQFCRQHRAQCLFYHLQSDDGGGCKHPRWGRRHPSYCKLAAVAHALFAERRHRAPSYRHVLFLDSDCFWRDSQLSAFDLLRLYGAPATQFASQHPSYEDRTSYPEQLVASFGWDSVRPPAIASQANDLIPLS